MKKFLPVLLSIPMLLLGATTINISQISGSASGSTGALLGVLPNSKTLSTFAIGPNCSVSNNIFNCVGSGTQPVIPSPVTEMLSGTIDGTNTTFTLSQSPITNSQLIFRNGVALFPGAGDFTINGTSIVFQPGQVPQPGDVLVAQYWH